VDKSWQIWMIDHTRAFKIFKVLKSESDLTESCERSLLASLRRLEKPALQVRMAGLLNEGQVNGLLGRRDKIVRVYDKRIADRGEESVLYDLPSRVKASR